MRQLVLYSDQVIAANQQVDHYLLQLLGNAARIGYISSSSDPTRQYFNLRQQYYQQMTLNLRSMLNLM